MTAHRRRMHRTEPAIDLICLPVSQTVHQPQVDDVSFLQATKQCPCPFPVCPGSFHTWNFLRSHFNRQHWGNRIRILEEHPNPLLRCKQCGSQVPAGRLNNRHYASEKCKQGYERRIRRETLQHCFDASRVSFHINAETLPPLKAFPYLGHTIAYNNSDWEAVYLNLIKARRRWGIIAMVLEIIGATVRAQGEMYKAVAQLVLLYGSNKWVVTVDMLKLLMEFHHWEAQ